MLRHLPGLFMILSIFSFASLAQADDIRFAPLPMLEEKTLRAQFSPMLEYLGKQTGANISWHYLPQYSQILDALLKNQLDLAYLGPLPYVKLTAQSRHFEPLVYFRESSGATTYECALIAFGEDRELGTADIKNKYIGLTQPESTCGYLAVSVMLKRSGRSLRSDGNSFDYVGGHDKAALGVLEGKYDVAGLKKAIALRYAPLDIHIIDVTGPYPGFALVANKQTLSLSQIAALREALLNSGKQEAWGKRFRNGAMSASDDDYRQLRADWKAVEKLMDSQ